MYAHTTAAISLAGGGGGPAYDPAITITRAVDGTYNIPVGFLAFINIQPVGALAAFNMGITPGGTELINGADIAAGGSEDFSTGIHFNAATTLYMTGITSSTQITFYKF